MPQYSKLATDWNKDISSVSSTGLCLAFSSKRAWFFQTWFSPYICLVSSCSLAQDQPWLYSTVHPLNVLAIIWNFKHGRSSVLNPTLAAAIGTTGIPNTLVVNHKMCCRITPLAGLTNGSNQFWEIMVMHGY